ncbi:MAG: hypothetical protein EPN86_00235 [Nanoarchaeota archaeon]|nr:MAG: hypothetical protein EPN86_00235 [Nanoarchaeota archaeon]
MRGLVDVRIEDNIECRITNATLEKRLSEDLVNGHIRAEQWFRDASLWYELAISYNNPYNHRKVHSELFLLHQKRDDLAGFLKDATPVFYGIGVGETEIELVGWQLEYAGYAEAIGIDVNSRFIQKFVGGLRNKAKENPEYAIMFLGYNSLFDQITPEDLQPENSRFGRRAHICLGNTIGNYEDQNEIMGLFCSNSAQGDLLVLGFQLDTDLEILFRKYSTNLDFWRLILAWDGNPDYSALRWELDRENGLVKARYRGLEVFRSRKFNPVMLKGIVENHGYEFATEVIDEDRNACIQIYGRN